ncbi:hypothetical protein [Mesorhizobium sp. SP-1A]|uniref:hypothetical protein n=1 Tax=Mesorhizobium sp. SP-1A TaxID=3077840 RepID=UPI0028F6FA87|nr:hypothetical protein [Mesorhizobium sp. SP-1A]
MAKKRRGKKKSHIGAYMLAGGLFAASAAVLGGIGYLYNAASKEADINKETLCPTSGPTAVTAFLIDTTDPLSDTTLLDLRTNFQKTSASIPVGSLLEIYALTDKPGDLKKLFGRCNPGDASNVSEWTANPRLRQKRWQELFKNILDQVAEDLPKAEGGEASPIMAGIQKIKLAVFDQYDAHDIPKQLLIASDMIEHTPSYSQYKSGIDYATYKKSAARTEFATSLKGIEIGIWYIDRRNRKFGSIEHNEFWAKWVVDNGGEFLSPIRLEGMN